MSKRVLASMAGSFVLGMLSLVPLACVTRFAAQPEEPACRARWQDSGYAWRYDADAGCQVKNEGGHWLPESRVRIAL